MMGGQRGGMGMMMGQPPMDAGDEDEDDVAQAAGCIGGVMARRAKLQCRSL